MRDSERMAGDSGMEGAEVAPTRVLLVGGDRLFCDCLAAQIAELPGVVVVGRARDLAIANAWLRRSVADVALVELGRATRADLVRLRRLACDRPELRVLVLGLSPASEHFAATAEGGAAGWLAPDASPAELADALASAREGQVHCTPAEAHELFRLLAERARERARREQAEELPLTPRELEVLRLVAGGLTNRAIAERIHLSLHTVKSHVHRILEKLGVDDRAAAATEADRRGWLRERAGARLRLL